MRIQTAVKSGVYYGAGNRLSQEPSVYIPESSIRQITQEQLDTARNSSGAKYYLCERCGKRSGSGIYITDYGEKYHYDKNCSGLKRSIFSVPLSEVQDKGACSKCAGYNSG